MMNFFSFTGGILTVNDQRIEKSFLHSEAEETVGHVRAVDPVGPELNDVLPHGWIFFLLYVICAYYRISTRGAYWGDILRFVDWF